MGVTLFALLALLVVVTTVSSLKNKMLLPTKAMSLHGKCIAKPGFDGECWVCYQGRCQKLPRRVLMLEQTPTSWTDYCECYVVGGTNTRRPERN